MAETSLSTPPREHRHAPVRKIAIWGPMLVVLVLALLVVLGAWNRMRQRHEQESFAKEAGQISVNAVSVERDTKTHELILPGNIQAFQETVLYPRANGYVRKWNVDIGDIVKEGAVLAEIETPEVDQQLAQARATYELAKVTAERSRDLVAKKVVAAQEFDEKQSALETAKANLQQLEQTQGFKRIVAPFDGKITARKVDVGALVSPTTQLFGIAQSDPLRVFIYVPQTNVPAIRENMPALVLVQEYSGQTFEGKVTRSAGALDPASRTMQVEVQVPNKDGRLFAGMYGQVKFQLQDPNPPIVIPANAFAFRADGAQVATISDDNKIKWQPVRVGRDFGTQLEVTGGLQEYARVVLNPTDDLHDGMQVEVKTPEPPKPAPGASQSPPAK